MRFPTERARATPMGRDGEAIRARVAARMERSAPEGSHSRGTRSSPSHPSSSAKPSFRAERPVIAAVYLNRLRTRMLLQADPTVQYARGTHTARVLHKDLEIDSRTTPTSIPGFLPDRSPRPAVRASWQRLFPADVDFLYFVAAPDGHHEFRRTLSEHEAAVRSVRR